MLCFRRRVIQSVTEKGQNIWRLLYFVLLKLWIVNDWSGNKASGYLSYSRLLILKTSALNFQMYTINFRWSPSQMTGLLQCCFCESAVLEFLEDAVGSSQGDVEVFSQVGARDFFSPKYHEKPRYAMYCRS